MTQLLYALGLCILGAIVSVVAPGRIGRLGGFALLGLAGIASLAAAFSGFDGDAQIFVLGYPQTHIALRLDTTAAFFIGILGLVAAIVALFALGPRSSDERRTGRTASASACAILFASVLACSAGDILLFIFAWELLALTFYWAIAYAGTDAEAASASYITIAVTHIAGACMVAALLYLAHGASGFEVASVLNAGSSLSGAAAGVVLALLLVGFGAKFGMLPMQAWLPYGYSAAPSVVAALMAGGALNVGFYGVTRFIVGFPNVPLWLGIVAIIIAVRNTFGDAGTLLASEFTGTGNFTYWIAAVLVLGMIGYSPTFRTPARLFLVLVILVFFLKQGTGFFSQLQSALSGNETATPPTVQPTPTSPLPVQLQVTGGSLTSSAGVGGMNALGSTGGISQVFSFLGG